MTDRVSSHDASGRRLSSGQNPLRDNYDFSATLQALVDVLNDAHQNRCEHCAGSGVLLGRGFCGHCKGHGYLDIVKR